MSNIKIKTRFPPEPNGYLHLGHAKSIYNNFNYPNTQCHIRLDDTNPKAEKQEYVDSIINDVKWLGYNTNNITYTSDYFDKLIEFAKILISKGYAYVDKSTSEEIKNQRKNKLESKYSETSIEENIIEFNKMIGGEYMEGSAVLRLKIPQNERTNECMHDPIAYRIINSEHYRTKNKYCVYPSYEFSHYIVDSLEGITHSFCTLEFYVRRNLSYWILDKLELTKPMIEETNRLETNFGTLSKRKIKKLIEDNKVSGWNDSRLLTISGLRNRGISAELINKFCSELYYTKNATATIQEHKFNSIIRNYLNPIVPRRMAIVNPLKVILYSGIEKDNNENFEEYLNNKINITKPLYPNSDLPNKKDIVANTCISNSNIFIEKDDFMASGATRKYKRLAPGRAVRLKYFGIIEYFKHDDNNIYCYYYTEDEYRLKKENETATKIWGTIHWIDSANYTESNLIISKYDGTYEIKSIMLDKIDVIDNSGYWQFERLGFYHVSNNCETIKEIVSLRDSKNK